MCTIIKTTLFTLNLLVLFLFFNETCADAANEFNPNVLCTYIANNTMIKDPTACNKYFTCSDQKPISGICQGNLFYERNSLSCVEPDTVICYSSNPCAATPGVNGFVADPYSCNGYYYCLHGQGTHGNCSPGMNFNPDTKNCIRNFPCDSKILPDDYCNIVPDGAFIKVPNSCTEYQTCWHGELLNGTCPDTFYFNALTGKCDYPANVLCNDVTTLAPEIPSAIKCNKAGVFISDGVSCNGYYYCKSQPDGSIVPIHSTCPTQRFFDPSNGGACVIRTNITCIHNRCVTLCYQNIQLANINSDGCTGFLICQNGEIIGRSECPTGEYFNELLQLCTTDVVSYPACTLTLEATNYNDEIFAVAVETFTTKDANATSF